MPWKWATIRAAFLKTRGDRPQADIAKPAGLRQNAISKLENNKNLGPAVQIFLNAVEGLGVPVSKFFEELERSQNTPLQSGEPLGDTAATNPQGEAASHGTGSRSAAATLRQDYARILAQMRAIRAEARRMEIRLRAIADPRGTKAARRKNGRSPSKKAS